MVTDPERTREYAGIIRNSGQHLLEVVNTLLDMSRIQSGHFDYTPEPFDLSALIQTCCNLMQLKFDQAGIALVRDASVAPVEITADLRACRQMMTNLLSNAVKFTPAGGRVEVAVRRSDSHIDFIVTDTGIGIAAADLPRVGDPFFQAQSDTRRSHEGTGLGLSVVQGLVGLHGGAIAIESVPGHGTSVIVTLPAVCREEANLAGPAPIRTASRTPGGLADAFHPPAPSRRPIGLFDAASDPVRESYVPGVVSPLRRAG